ncbi:MAG: hypothetical protein M3P85_08620 [Actinomycetota bacterium]|nr:hypothetical protein [Actinomycetota bacterium]
MRTEGPEALHGDAALPRQPMAAVPSRRQLLAVWLATAVVLAVLLLVARAARTGGDDADQARQRPGFLDAGALPVPAPSVAGLPKPGRRAVVFFAREDVAGELCQELAGSPPILDRADAAVVVAGTPPPTCPPAPVVADQDGVLARAYGLPTPRDGGPPTGYAVVDSEGRVRYRTLDPEVVAELAEVATILRATP